jgi:methylated-DNA-[protein]-cysteine S-methyltransferase
MTCYATVIDSPVDRLLVAVDDNGALVALEFAGHRSPDALVAALDDVVWDETRCRAATDAVSAYFRGDRGALDGLAVAPRGTDFQRAVWRAVRKVPYGRTASYGEIARRLGRPGASRAVGQANGANPVCLVVPCHRVVGADGSLTGFGGGIEVKKKLLSLEARHGT